MDMMEPDLHVFQGCIHIKRLQSPLENALIGHVSAAQVLKIKCQAGATSVVAPCPLALVMPAIPI